MQFSKFCNQIYKHIYLSRHYYDFYMFYVECRWVSAPLIISLPMETRVQAPCLTDGGPSKFTTSIICYPTVGSKVIQGTTLMYIMKCNTKTNKWIQNQTETARWVTKQHISDYILLWLDACWLNSYKTEWKIFNICESSYRKFQFDSK